MVVAEAGLIETKILHENTKSVFTEARSNIGWGIDQLSDRAIILFLICSVQVSEILLRWKHLLTSNADSQSPLPYC